MFLRTAILGCTLAYAAGSSSFLDVIGADKNEHHRILVVGGGSAGITAAAQLKRKLKKLDIAIVEPSKVHYYQPLWTMVGGGLFKVKDSRKPMSSVIPKNCPWLKESVESFDPEHNRVTLASGKVVEYDYLIVAAGLSVNIDGIKGLRETLGKNGVCSIYLPEHAEYVWKRIKKAKKGNALFTVPLGPVKCGGAPQKIMYLAEDTFRDAGLRAGDSPAVNVLFTTALTTMFPVPYYAEPLNEIRKSKGIDARFQHELIEVRGDAKQAVFKTPEGERVIEFEMLHVVPPMCAPTFIKNSPLADASGFVDVDKETTQHKKYPNVFSFGDCSNLPTSKTAAAIAGQAPVLVSNLVSLIEGKPMTAKYDGYTSCPLITGKSSLMLAEFLYGGVPTSTFGIDSRQPRYPFFLMKKYVFPWAYWNLMLRGRWYGRHHVIHPSF